MSITSRPTFSTESKSSRSFAHPHIISIPDSASSVSCPSSTSSCEGSSFSFRRIVPREPGHKRRRMNTRSGSSSFSFPTPPPSPNHLHLSSKAVNTSKRPIPSLEFEPTSPLGPQSSRGGRLILDRSIMTVPCPPRPPTDELAKPFDPRPSPSYILPPPYILPSPSFTDTGVCNQISTCIRSTDNPYSVSISPHSAFQLARQSTKSTRPRRPPNTIHTGSGTSTPVLRMRAEDIELNRDRSRDVEQTKWWHWITPCSRIDGSNDGEGNHVTFDDLGADDEDEIVTKCAIVCPLDEEWTNPHDKSKWRIKHGL